MVPGITKLVIVVAENENDSLGGFWQIDGGMFCQGTLTRITKFSKY
jgi:hypothetical protein